MNVDLNLNKPLQTLREHLLKKPLLERLLPIFSTLGCPPILVGGMLRDYLIREHIGCDLDFIIPGNVFDTLCQTLSTELNGHVIPLDPENGIARVVFPDTPEYIDLATQQGDSVEVDLARRDLSINAIAMNLGNGDIFDPFDGIADTLAQRIRLIKEQNLDDDPLRLLRVYRFAARFERPIITDETQQAVLCRASRIKEPAVERSQYELQSLFSSPYFLQTLPWLLNSGLLPALFPEQRDHPETDTKLLFWYEIFEEILGHKNFPSSLHPELASALTPCLTRLGVLRYALYLNAMGTSASAGNTLGKRLKWSQQLTHRVFHILTALNTSVAEPETLIRTEEELILAAMLKGAQAALTDTPKQTGKTSPSAGSLFSFEADCSALSVHWAARPDTNPKSKTIFIETILETINKDWAELLAYREREAAMPYWLSGHDIQHRWGLQPGPRIGDLLKALRQAQHQGQVQNQSDAIAFVENSLKPS